MTSLLLRLLNSPNGIVINMRKKRDVNAAENLKAAGLVTLTTPTHGYDWMIRVDAVKTES